MADNYLQFSFEFDIPKDRADDVRALLVKISERNDAAEVSADEWLDLGDIVVEDDKVWAYSEINCSPYDTAMVCAKILDLVDSDDRVGFSYAWTCNKPRLDEFGGGAIVFDRTGVVGHESAHSVLERLMTEGRQ